MAWTTGRNCLSVCCYCRAGKCLQCVVGLHQCGMPQIDKDSTHLSDGVRNVDSFRKTYTTACWTASSTWRKTTSPCRLFPSPELQQPRDSQDLPHMIAVNVCAVAFDRRGRRRVWWRRWWWWCDIGLQRLACSDAKLADSISVVVVLVILRLVNMRLTRALRERRPPFKAAATLTLT